MLLDDSVTAMQNHIAALGWEPLYHPPYNHNLAPNDFHLLPALKKNLSGKHFESNAEVKQAVKLFFQAGIVGEAVDTTFSTAAPYQLVAHLYLIVSNTHYYIQVLDKIKTQTYKTHCIEGLMHIKSVTARSPPFGVVLNFGERAASSGVALIACPGSKIRSPSLVALVLLHRVTTLNNPIK
ncbi:hypothetical protein TNCV_3365791 [Trichonephila clavipes]|nr:hypothetical protein TNCV_3365791 [Trichonephila clavipes]